MSETLQDIISRFWVTPERGEWTQKTDVVPLPDIRRWFASDDIEILGFVHSLIHDGRFHIEPPLSIEEYKDFVKTYYERCLGRDSDGEWSEGRYMAGTELVNIFAALWRDASVPREILQELRDWLGQLYRSGEAETRTCIVNATLEHLFEQEDIREFFSGWKDDPVLAVAHKDASEWYLGGGSSPLGKPPIV